LSLALRENGYLLPFNLKNHGLTNFAVVGKLDAITDVHVYGLLARELSVAWHLLASCALNPSKNGIVAA
jgi:hypothetical protein